MKSLRNLFRYLVLLILACCTPRTGNLQTSSRANDSLALTKRDYVFDTPQPFAQCHASTLVHTGNGNFVVAWFGGTHEKHRDVGIWLSHGKPGAWSAPEQVAKIREEAHWNPVLFKAPSGEIILCFKVGKTIDVWETWFKSSRDNGVTWSDAQVLVVGDRGGRGPVRNKMIRLTDGAWLAPASVENKGVWNAFVDRSEDQGKTWTASSFIPFNRDSISGEGIIQPTLWESAPNRVHMLLRSSAGVICRSDSEDNGKTWSAAYKTDLPNPNSAIDVARLHDGSLVLAYNPAGRNWGSRNLITLALSKDNGRTWPFKVNIEEGQQGDEYSYPAIIATGDTLAGTYTWKRRRIAFWMAMRVKGTAP